MPAAPLTLGGIIRTYWPALAVSFRVAVVATAVCRRFALAQAVRSLIEDTDSARRFGQGGRQRIDQGFRTNQCTRAIIEAFARITDRADQHSG